MNRRAGHVSISRTRDGGECHLPRYYIDTCDGDVFIRDEIGVVACDLQAAKDAAVDALPDMARDMLPDGDRRTFLAIVRDGEDRSLIRASLTLLVTSLVTDAGPAPG